MERRVGTLIFVLFFLIPLINAQYILPPAIPEEGSESLVLNIVDAQTREPIRNETVFLDFQSIDGKERWSYMAYSGEDGKASLLVQKGKWIVVGKIHELQSEGSDYISYEMETEGGNEAELIMWPSGSIRGKVYAKDGELIADSSVGASCAYTYGEQNVKSDAFGVFFFQYLPVGRCVVTASKGNEIGTADITVEKGKITEANVVLGERMKIEENYMWLLAAGIIVILIVIGAFVWKIMGEHKKKLKKTSEKIIKSREKKESRVAIPVHSFGEIPATQRMLDIMKALNEKEKSIVEFLLKNGGKARQSKISYTLMMPKTSLLRALYSLEHRNIVVSKKFGTIKEIKLSEWFLGGNEKRT